MPSFTFPLAADGPLLEITVSVSRSRRYVLTRFGLPVPQPVKVRALIDTGATFSCLDDSVFSRLDLSSKGTVPILAPTTGAIYQLMNRYDVDLELLATPTQRLFLLEDFPVLEAPLAAQGIEGLIGRDVLSRCVFVYDGTANTFSLSF